MFVRCSFMGGEDAYICMTINIYREERGTIIFGLSAVVVVVRRPAGVDQEDRGPRACLHRLSLRIV